MFLRRARRVPFGKSEFDGSMALFPKEAVN